MQGKNPPTLSDVAELAGVSPATVSRSLNFPDKVSSRKMEIIESAITELGYVPNFGGRALASNQTTIIGALIPSMGNAMFANGLQAFQETLAAANLSLVLATTGYDPTEEAKQARALIAQGASSLLLIGKQRDPKTLEFLDRRNVPYILAWCFDRDGDQTYVGFDNVLAAKTAANRAIEFGHKNVGLICGICEDNDRARDRKTGFEAAVAEAGGQTKITECLEAKYSLENGRIAFQTLMTKAPNTTVVLCGNDVLAAGAMLAAREKGMDVPKDISIVGFDDIGLASVTVPAMTTVRVPQHQMGRLAAEVLLEKRAGNSTVASIELNTEFILRGSLSFPKGH